MLYHDRHEAGRRLARELSHLRGEHPVILALPRGGVEVGHAVALALEAPLDVIVVRKLGAPQQPEFGFGAVAHGVRLLDDASIRLLAISDEQVEQVARRETVEMKRRERLYRNGAEAPEVAGRTAVIVDDGLATGGTARAAVKAVGVLDPDRIVLAVPVAPPETAMQLAEDVDEFVCLATPQDFGAVGRWYLNFEQTTDEQVIDLLQDARTRLAEALR